MAVVESVWGGVEASVGRLFVRLDAVALDRMVDACIEVRSREFNHLLEFSLSLFPKEYL